MFKAIQTYSDGTTVSWIETPAPGSTAEPDHPAPTLSLASADTTTAKPSKSSNTAPVILSIVALVVAAAALGVAVVGRARRNAG